MDPPVSLTLCLGADPRVTDSRVACCLQPEVLTPRGRSPVICMDLGQHLSTFNLQREGLDAVGILVAMVQLTFPY